ncbi:hypothetical protein OUZ56_005424 [Daphnia magna]|uniref:Uncharacterized protein n=1 Tax=Daphnia magna TaxID=35525 RepID=A0ABQ9YSQ6_9CRUS|nr:hypothetical protein OUZ56_005424 [Daphnia magna]
MFTLSEVLFDWRYFEVAVVRFAEIVFHNTVSWYRRLNLRDRRLFTTLLNEAKDTCLDFTPFSGEVWKLDFYYSTYTGYAKDHDFYSRNYARLLWWLESGSAGSTLGRVGSFELWDENTESEAL